MADLLQSGQDWLADQLPPGRQCAESDDDVRALTVFMEAIEQAQSMDRHSVRDRAAWQFDTDRIMDIVSSLDAACLEGGIEAAGSI